MFMQLVFLLFQSFHFFTPGADTFGFVVVVVVLATHLFPLVPVILVVVVGGCSYHTESFPPQILTVSFGIF